MCLFPDGWLCACVSRVFVYYQTGPDRKGDTTSDVRVEKRRPGQKIDMHIGLQIRREANSIMK